MEQVITENNGKFIARLDLWGQWEVRQFDTREECEQWLEVQTQKQKILFPNQE